MKSNSIGQYFSRQQQLYTSIISIILLLTALILLSSTHYQLRNTVADNQEQIILRMEQFFQDYQIRSEEYTQNQKIRNLMRYAIDAPGQEWSSSAVDLFLPYDVKFYVNGKLAYPSDTDSALTEEILQSVNRDMLIFYDNILYYLVPYYNFTQNQQLGIICYMILPYTLADYCTGSIPSQVEFCLYDSCGNEFYRTPDTKESLSDYTFSSQNMDFSGTVFIDSHSEYQNCLLFLSILFISCCLGIGLSTYLSWELASRIVSPINELAASLKHNQEGELTAVPLSPSGLKEIDQISSAYEEMLCRIRQLVEQNHKQNLLKAESELKVLQERINPHFLFNTLELISSQAILEDADKTAQLAQKLGSLFRYSLRMPDVLHLRQEIRYAKDYLFLQNARYNEKINYHIDMPDSLSQFLIPKLTLQPILENCFKHGFSDETDRFHEIQITVRVTEHNVTISVLDDGRGISRKAAEELNQNMLLDIHDFSHFIRRGDHIGLRNVNARLYSYYHTASAVALQPAEHGGTLVTITLPHVPPDTSEERKDI